MKEIKNPTTKRATNIMSKSAVKKPAKKPTRTKSPKAAKKEFSPDSAHWIKSQAKLVKIMEAAGMTPEHQKPMLTCHRER